MRFFTLSELGAEREDQFHPGFLDELDSLRDVVGLPFIINSGARTRAHNAKVGGTPKSLHIWDEPQNPGQKGCMAVDVHVPHPSFKLSVVRPALQMGWSCGINDKAHFIHLDKRVMIGMPQAIFAY